MNNSDQKKVMISDYLKPRNWLVLVCLLIARIITLLPIHAIQSLGKIIGIILHSIPSSRKNIAKKNIDLCFTELSNDERKKLLKNHFEIALKSHSNRCGIV